MKRKYHIIGCGFCWGAQIHACEMGPQDLIKGHIFQRLEESGVNLTKVDLLKAKPQAKDANIPLSQTLDLIHDFNLQVVQAVRKAVKNGEFPIVVGGDHSIAVGTWNSFDVPFGLIWIDAHADAHTPETSPSGAYHGMPVAALLGYGAEKMAHLTRHEPRIKPENLVYIGVRSFEEGEMELLKKLNVKIYFMDEVKKRGLKAILSEAIAYVTQRVAHFGVSLDLDFFAVEDAPGVGSPEKNGVHKKDFLPFISLFGNDPRLLAFEIVEFNPERDIQHKTRELVLEILKEFTKT